MCDLNDNHATIFVSIINKNFDFFMRNDEYIYGTVNVRLRFFKKTYGDLLKNFLLKIFNKMDRHGENLAKK